MISAYHPQTDGQTEVVNKCLEQYLRSLCCLKPKEWSKWLSLAEFWYNTNEHSSTRMSPYEAVYGTPPPKLISYVKGTTMVEAVDQELRSREVIMATLKDNLMKAQQRMKHYADQNRTEREFEEGDWVFLRLQPYRQQTVNLRKNLKLSSKYYGPFQILQKVGKVAYKLALPISSKIHPVFHVSWLKKKIGNKLNIHTSLPSSNQEGVLITEPQAILARRMVKMGNRVATKVLVQWSGLEKEDATWEFLHKLQQKFPNFSIEGDAGAHKGRMSCT